MNFEFELQSRKCLYFQINNFVNGMNPLIIFTNPTVLAGYDTRSIFKQSLTGLNSEISFS